MPCDGRGNLTAEMLRLAGQLAGKIITRDAVPYAEFVNISRCLDVFVCCHIQIDPPCTYLESYGAGLPIVGYANRM
jgi:colanic acid/amylovoran biosynthesis glycosyltransferase